MLHDHRGFDRTDPDAAQALEHALPVVADLLGAQRLPQPKRADELAAWRDHIAELEADVVRIADRGGVEPAALRGAAERQLRRDAARPAQTGRPAPEAAPAPSSTDAFASLASEDARLAREIATLERDGARIARDLKVRRAAQRKVHRQLFSRGRKLG